MNFKDKMAALAVMIGIPGTIWLCTLAGWKVTLAIMLILWANNISNKYT